MKRLLLLSIVWLGCLNLAQASLPQSQLDITQLQNGQTLTAELSFIEDKEGRFSLEDVVHLSWQAMDSDQLTFGYTHSVYWFHLKLINPDETITQRFLSIDYPVLDYIDIYQRDSGGAWAHHAMGDKYPFDAREIKNRNFVLPLELKPQQTIEYVFRINTASSMQFPLTIWAERSFFENDQKQVLGLGLYYGIMLVMVFYNFFVFFATREINYLYYVGYAAFVALFLASLQGLSFQYFWPQAIHWNDKSIIVFLSVAIIFGILFTRSFLHIQKIFHINFILSLLVGILLLVLSFINVLSYHVLIQTTIFVAFICLNLAFGAGVVRWMQGYVAARYYTIAWFSILFGGVILALNKLNIIPRNFFTENIVQLGSALEVILLSFALADRLNSEKRKRYKAQIKALSNERLAREAQQKVLEVQKRANETLEQRVKERTEALQEANKQLEFMSITDPLTNIRNRRYFDRTLTFEISRAVREQESISVLIIDLDYFKQVNDTYGHQTGDTVLKSVALKLSQIISRSTDLLARFGGEEFVVILPNTSVEGAQHVAECIRNAVTELEFSEEAPELQLSASIGVFGAVPSVHCNPEHWVRNADDALYKAKKSGRNQVVVYSLN